MAGLSYLRFAAGVCVLAACLLIGGVGGAVAVADPDASGSTAHGDNGANGSGKQPSSGAKKPTDEPGGTDTNDGSPGGHSGQQHSAGAKNPTDEPGDTDAKDGTKDDLDLGAAVPDPLAAVPNEVAPVSDPVAPASGGPEVPANGRPSGNRDATDAPPAADSPGPSVPPTSPTTGGTPAASGLPVPGEATTEVAPLDVNALGRASAVSGMAPLAPDAAFPIGAGSSLRHVFGEILLPVSLWALAAGALPGASGLVILSATGVRVGYRQAKAGFVVQAAGIGCFARPGPLGVVHSGSIIAVRPRALRTARPRASSGRFDKVA